MAVKRTYKVKYTEHTRDCAIYCRVSTEDQAKEGFSLDAQIKQCKGILKAHGYDPELAMIYVDNVSAKNNDRDGLQDLINALHKEKVEFLATKIIDRLTRSNEHQWPLWNAIEKSECKVFDQTGEIERRTPGGRLTTQIRVSVAEEHRLAISQSVHDTMHSMVENGQWITRPPYGYRKCDYQDKGRKGVRSYTLEPDPLSRDTCKRIFQLYADGISTTKIAKIFNDESIPTPTQSHGGSGTQGLWRANSIRKILENPVYGGKFVFGKSGTRCVTERDFPFERIIDTALYSRSQRRVKEDKHRKGPKTISSPYSKICICGICGRTLALRSEKRNTGHAPQMVCFGDSDAVSAGRMHFHWSAISFNQLDKIASLVLDLAEKSQPLPVEDGIRDEERSAILETLAAERKKAVLALKQGGIDDSEFVEWTNEINSKEAALQVNEEASPEHDNIVTIKRMWDDLGYTDQNNALRFLVNGIFAQENEIRVILKAWKWAGWPKAIVVKRRKRFHKHHELEYTLES